MSVSHFALEAMVLCLSFQFVLFSCDHYAKLRPVTADAASWGEDGNEAFFFFSFSPKEAHLTGAFGRRQTPQIVEPFLSVEVT